MNAAVMLIKLSAFFFFPFLINFTLAAGEYSETATLTYLPNFNILSNVHFKLISQEIKSSADSTDLGNFPSLIHTLSNEFGLIEGKLAFTRGFWDTLRWSKAPNNPTSSGFQFQGHFSITHESNLG